MLFEVWAWEEGDWDVYDPDDCRMGDDGKLPVEDCLDSSRGMLALADIVGMPMRSENGWPNASQSFSTSAYIKVKDGKNTSHIQIYTFKTRALI